MTNWLEGVESGTGQSVKKYNSPYTSLEYF